MNEREAIQWVEHAFGAPALDRLRAFVTLLIEASEHQNLISKTTVGRIWARHIVDSAQLVLLAPAAGSWVDVGSGGGLPGLVVAMLRPEPTFLLEPRRKRADFLAFAAGRLGLRNVTTLMSRAERFHAAPARVVSARAVATIDQLLASASGFSDDTTVFVFPKGASAKSDLALAQATWQGVFHVKHSITDETAGIVTATGVKRR